MSDYDVIIIGAGHNGLTAANVLAQQGKQVLITEKTNFPGGMATTRELFPGISTASARGRSSSTATRWPRPSDWPTSASN